MKIGDRCQLVGIVNNNKGTIAGVVRSAAYLETMPDWGDIWNKPFPGWKERLIVLVELDELSVPASVNDLKKFQPTFNDEQIQKLYDRQEKRKFLVIPEEKVKVFYL